VEMEIFGFLHDVEMSANTIAFMQPIQDSINSKNSFGFYDLYDNLRKSMNSVLLTNHNIKSVIIDLKNTELSFSDMNLVLDDIKGIEVESYKTYFSGLLPYTYTSDLKTLNYFAAVYRVNNIRNLTSKEYSGNIIFILSKSRFDDISSQYGITKHSKLYIINNHNEVIGRMNGTIDDATEKMILEQVPVPETTSLLNINNEMHIYHTRNVSDTGWRIVSLTPYNEYFEELHNITLITFIIFFAVIVTMLGFSILITSNINSPIQNMLRTMKSIKSGNLKTRSNIKLNNELGILSDHFNEMMDEINTLTHKIFNNQQTLYELELANKDARFSALQSQINPHFLYNALACIQGIALHYDIGEIAKVTQALASIFRYSIKENNYVTISAEVENIKNYVMIYQIKSADTINLNIDIDPEVYRLLVPKLLFQPVAENAIIHGLTKKIGGGTLTIRGFKLNNNIHFEFTDDGMGMHKEQLDELNRAIEDTIMPSEMKNDNRSIGIINIKQRLKLRYSNSYSFNVESGPQEGTKVTIEIPFEEGENI